MDKSKTRYIPQKQPSLVLVSFVATWSLPPWASGNDELAMTLREEQQRAHSRAKVVADWISKQVSARQTIDDASSKGVINKISTVARGAHLLLVVALAIALAVFVIAIATFVTKSDAATVEGGNNSYLISWTTTLRLY